MVGCPCTWNIGVVNQSSLVDLEEFKSRFVDGAAVSVAVGQVSDDWAVVGFGPFSPLKVDFITCVGWCGESCVGGILGADNVWSGVLRWGFETEIEVGVGPSVRVWLRGLVGIGDEPSLVAITVVSFGNLRILDIGLDLLSSCNGETVNVSVSSN